MPYHPVVEKIRTLLFERGAWFETFEHEPVRTSEEAAKLRYGYALSQGAKALIVRGKIAGEGKKFLMIVVSGDKRFDADKLKQAFNIRDVRFATEAEVSEITRGILPGGVPPFGGLFGLEIYADRGIFDNEKIVFNAGDRAFSIAMKSEEYRRIALPKVGDIS